MERGDLLRRIAVPFFYVLQLVAVFINPLTGGRYGTDVRAIGDNSSQSQTSVAIQPPGPFFAIWGIIYILLSIHCVAQLRPGWTADEALRQSGWWLAAGLALTSAWGFVATLWAVTPTNAVPQQWILAVILCSMAALVVKSLTILREFAESMPSLERALLLPGPSLFGGWITIACVLNTACALRVSGVTALAPFAPGSGASAVALLFAVALATSCTALLDGNPVYAAGLAWGFLGGAVGNLSETRSGVGPSVPHPTLGWACLLAAVAVVSVVVSGLVRGTAQKWLPAWCCACCCAWGCGRGEAQPLLVAQPAKSPHAE